MTHQNEKLLSLKEVADLIGVSARTVNRIRKRGVSPKGYLIGTRCYYKRSEVLEWLERQKETVNNEDQP